MRPWTENHGLVQAVTLYVGPAGFLALCASCSSLLATLKNHNPEQLWKIWLLARWGSGFLGMLQPQSFRTFYKFLKHRDSPQLAAPSSSRIPWEATSFWVELRQHGQPVIPLRRARCQRSEWCNNGQAKMTLCILPPRSHGRHRRHRFAWALRATQSHRHALACIEDQNLYEMWKQLFLDAYGQHFSGQTFDDTRATNLGASLKICWYAYFNGRIAKVADFHFTSSQTEPSYAGGWWNTLGNLNKAHVGEPSLQLADTIMLNYEDCRMVPQELAEEVDSITAEVDVRRAIGHPRHISVVIGLHFPNFGYGVGRFLKDMDKQGLEQYLACLEWADF